jgi:parallel beta-helix repeat protein
MLSMAGHATDYYVSSSGSDSANGLSSSTPWQSILKINSVFPTLKPGDRILFKSGDHFYGSLQISVSGSSGSPITIGAYGTGASPVVSGFTTISEWTNYGGGIYSKSFSCQSNPNMVTINDVNTPIGRWPNTGFLYIDSHVSNSSITDSDLPLSPDWTGAEVVIRKNEYIWDRNKITDHTGSTLRYTSGSSYDANDGYGYFIQNNLKTLDQTGEWYYDGSTFYMYFGSAGPGNNVVEVSSIDQLVFIKDKNYIIIDNIAFEGANLYAVQINNSDYVTVQNCRISFTGEDAIYGPWNGTSPFCKISNNNINNSNNNAINLKGDHTNAIVTNNIVSRTGMIIGMGKSSDGTYNALFVHGAGSLVQYNFIDNTGYMGIHFAGNNTVVSNNFVNRFNLVKNDGGGIYTYVGTGTPSSGQKIMNNVILNGYGYGDGGPAKEKIAFGIYTDDRVRNVVVTGNTVANCNSSGIYIHNAHEIEITRNTLFDNGSGNSDFGAQILLVHDSYSPDDPIRNLNINYNIFFAKSTSQKILSFSTISNDITSFGSADYNCYAKPLDNTLIARAWSTGWNSVATNRSLSSWQSYTGKDRNSYISPIGTTDPNKIIFEYNTTNSNKPVALDGSYIDVTGAKYSGSIILLPYSSVVLMPDPNPSAPPVVATSPPVVTAPVVINAPPVAVVNYSSTSYSGFVNELNATGSYDTNNDNLTFSWTVPNNVAVSSTNDSKIKFLSPIVTKPQTLVFTLKISDGKTTQSKVVPIEILPYQPNLEVAEIANIEASSFQSPDYPHNMLDGDIGTMWSASGDDQWIIFELKESFNIQHVRLAFKSGQIRESYFDILGSKDKLIWEPILTKSVSCSFSSDLQVFDLPQSKSEEEFQYVKLVGHGNSLDNWNYISEFRIFGYRFKNPSDYGNLIVKIYPNPARDIVNILIDDPSFNPDFINIVSLTGKILNTEKLDPAIRQFQIPVNFRPGIYIVQIGIGEMTMFTQKLVISH